MPNNAEVKLVGVQRNNYNVYKQYSAERRSNKSRTKKSEIMKTWLSGWRNSGSGGSGRNNKYKLLVDHNDSQRQFGVNKVKLRTQNRNGREEATYAIESGSLLDEHYNVSTDSDGLMCVWSEGDD